jgi:ubiquinone/menaquinone biosynthesis C-methylase UbiE
VSLCERLFAAVYDPLSARSERKFGADLKRQLLANAHGRVLEIGVGTGLSFLHYPPDVELAGVEPSPHMLKRARRRAAELGRKVELVEAPAEQLPFADDSFDTVVSLTVLCTVSDAQRTLGEIRRVLCPGGRFVFLVHVRSEDAQLARRQDRWERPWGWIAGGCHPNRRTLETIEAAGFQIRELEHKELTEVQGLVQPNILGIAV